MTEQPIRCGCFGWTPAHWMEANGFGCTHCRDAGNCGCPECMGKCTEDADPSREHDELCAKCGAAEQIPEAR